YSPVLRLKQQLPKQFIRPDREPAKLPASQVRWPAPSLEEYEAKRNFARTSEPKPAVPRRSQQGGKRRFVIQQHAASHLHYDLRLEISDTLKSWAVPKGMPLEKGARRSAFVVEDHPRGYPTFEGAIP